jgi:dihydroflavonol-4-reductase
MSRILLAGATGVIGNAIARQLAEEGHSVRAMVRSVAKARPLLPPNVECVAGDVTDVDAIQAAMDGCDVVYHAAGLPEQWLADPTTFDRVNAGGTANMVEAALLCRVRRFVYTSTIDVFPMENGEPFDESTIDTRPKATAYERSKAEADRIVTRALDRGLPAVFLHPSGLFGPGPATSPGTNNLIADLLAGRLPMLLPGGMPLVFSLDCAAGHILAERKAAVGDRFILSDRYCSLVDLAAELARLRPGTRIPPVLPRWVAVLLANAGELLSSLIGRAPLLPKGQLEFLGYEAKPVSTHAVETLGWKITPLTQALERTCAFLEAEGR